MNSGLHPFGHKIRGNGVMLELQI